MKYSHRKGHPPGVYQREDGKGYKIVVDTALPGEPRKQVTRYAAKLADAKIIREDLRKSVRDQTYIPTTGTTLRDFVEQEWLPTLAVQPSTRDSYSRMLRLHALPRLGGTRLQQITPQHVAKLCSDAQAGGLSASSTAYLHTILFGVFRVAVERQFLMKNPAERVKPPRRRESRSVMRTWTADTLRAFLDATRDSSDGDLWFYLATTGCRRGEALGAAWCDVDLDAATVTITRTVAERNDLPARWAWGDPKTDGSARTIDLDPPTVQMLRRHRKDQLQARLAVGAGWQGSGLPDVDLVFSGPLGEPLVPKTVSDRWAAAVRRSGLPRIRLHDTRHTWASLALRAGVPAKVVQERLGHANVKITLSIYAHVMPGMQSDAATKVSAMFTDQSDVV